MSAVSEVRERAALLTTLDRGLTLVARIATARATCSLPRFMILLEREARVRGIIRRAVEHALCDAADAGRYEWVRWSSAHELAIAGARVEALRITK